MEHNFRFGSYLVIPLRFEGDQAAVAPGLEPQPMTTLDLTENVKAKLTGVLLVLLLLPALLRRK
ncbi:MAG: hypothetical protein IJB04_01265 [Oscillospiraceae bacterium]|nr:hypothetical protein [Oscillospiraceae bacterium]